MEKFKDKFLENCRKLFRAAEAGPSSGLWVFFLLPSYSISNLKVSMLLFTRFRAKTLSFLNWPCFIGKFLAFSICYLKPLKSTC